MCGWLRRRLPLRLDVIMAGSRLILHLLIIGAASAAITWLC